MKRSNLLLLIGFLMVVIPNAVAAGVIDPASDTAKIVILLSTSMTMFLHKLGVDLTPINRSAAEDLRAAVRKELNEQEEEKEPGKPDEK